MRTFLVTAAIAALFVPAPAAAQPAANGEIYTVSIPYADLNLDSAEGQAAFQGRVKSEATRACGASKTAPLEEAGNIRECRAELIRNAGQRLELALSGAAATDTLAGSH